MNFVLDIGNTQLKAALFNDHEMVGHWIISFDDLNTVNELIADHEIERIGVSSVRSIPKELTQILERHENKVYSWDTSFKIPLNIEYKTPETLGHDRICNAVAAKNKFSKKNILVIDLGTCNKYDFVTKDGVYIGGAISPGFEMRYLSMNQFTDQLPLIELAISDNFVGDSTRNSMISGVFYGIIGEIKYYIEQYTARFNDIEVILTGGFSSYFDKVVKNHIFADPYLTLRGLNRILNFQEEK